MKGWLVIGIWRFSVWCVTGRCDLTISKTINALPKTSLQRTWRNFLCSQCKLRNQWKLMMMVLSLQSKQRRSSQAWASASPASRLLHQQGRRRDLQESLVYLKFLYRKDRQLNNSNNNSHHLFCKSKRMYSWMILHRLSLMSSSRDQSLPYQKE